MVSLYIPADIPAEYKYITNISNYYFDLYNVSDTHNTSGFYYRVYYGLDDDLYTFNTYNHTNYSGYITTEISRTNDFLARQDIPQICITTLTFSILIVFLFNIMTSIVKKGGLFNA